MEITRHGYLHVVLLIAFASRERGTSHRVSSFYDRCQRNELDIPDATTLRAPHFRMSRCVVLIDAMDREINRKHESQAVYVIGFNSKLAN